MNNNEEKKYGRLEYFELREKRLKLVYRILYVAVALWIATLLCMNKNTLIYDTIPFFSALLAITSLVIINIIKYALMEFRCMKVYGGFDEDTLKQTEEKYDRIWNSFAVILSGTALLMLLHISFLENLEQSILIIIWNVCFGISSSYFLAVSVMDFFKKKVSDKVFKVLNNIGVFVGNIAVYSICALLGLVIVS